MTNTTATTLTLQAQDLATDYNVACINFLWTSADGFDSFTVFASTPEAGVLTTAVPSFDYCSDIDDTRIRELLMTVIDDTQWDAVNISEIGGTLAISPTEAPVFEGTITSTSTTLIQY
jgi:hypothetical protein